MVSLSNGDAVVLKRSWNEDANCTYVLLLSVPVEKPQLVSKVYTQQRAEIKGVYIMKNIY